MPCQNVNNCKSIYRTVLAIYVAENYFTRYMYNKDSIFLVLMYLTYGVLDVAFQSQARGGVIYALSDPPLARVFQGAGGEFLRPLSATVAARTVVVTSEGDPRMTVLVFVIVTLLTHVCSIKWWRVLDT